jgi:hypothetical protein
MRRCSPRCRFRVSYATLTRNEAREMALAVLDATAARLWEREPFGLLGRPATRRRSRQSVLLLEDRASLAVLLETQFAFGEAPLEYVDPGFPTAARPGWASSAAAYQEHDADDEEEPEQWPGQDPQPASKSH